MNTVFGDKREDDQSHKPSGADPAKESTPDHTDENDIFSKLVGEGKRFKTPAELAKAKMEADAFIERLKEEKRGTLEALERAEKENQEFKRALGDGTLEDRAAKLTTTHQDGNPDTKPAIDREVIREELRAVQSEEQVERNRETVATKLAKQAGSEEAAQRMVADKARELGVDVEYLADVAGRSPKAFESLFGISSGESTNEAKKIDAEINSESLTHRDAGPREGTYSWYQEQRRAKGSSWFFSPQVQQRMHKDAQAAAAAGENFLET